MARKIPVGEAIEGYPEEEGIRQRRLPVGKVVEGFPPDEPAGRPASVPRGTERAMTNKDLARFGLPTQASGTAPMIGTSSGQVALNPGDAAAERAARAGIRAPAAATMPLNPLGENGPKFNRTMVPPKAPAVVPTAAPNAPVANALAAEARGLAGTAANVGRVAAGVGPALAGTLANKGADTLLAPSGGPGVTPYVSDGTDGRIPNMPGLNPRAPAAVEPSFFRDTDVGRNIGNIINAVPGVTSLPMNVLRAGSTAGKTLTTAGGVVRAAATDNAMAPSAARPFEPPGITLRATGAGGGREFVNPAPVVPAEDVGGIRREGNLFTDGSVRQPGEKTGFGGPEVAAIEARARAIEAENSELRRSLDPNFTAQGGPAISLSSGFGDRLQKLNDETTVASLRNDARLAGLGSGRQAAARAAALNTAATEAERTQASTRAATAQNSQGLRIAELNNATQRRGQDIVSESTRRGQDMTASTARAANQLAAQNAQRQQENLDRAFKLDVAKYGTEVAEKNRAAGAAAQKAQQERMENTFRTTDEKGNSVPDHAKIASFNASVDTTLPQLIGALQKTGTAAALAKAREIQERGAAALGPEDHAELVKLFQTREQLRSATSSMKSWLPGGAELRESDNLLSYRQAAGDRGIDRRALTPDRVVLQGGSSATVNDLTVRGGANAILPDWFNPRDDNIIRGLRRPE